MATHTRQPTITYDTAAHAVAAAVRIGAEVGIRAVVCVVDPSMNLVAFARADGATPHSVETSRRKADTAASTRRPSASMRADLVSALEHGSGGRLTSIAGGVPLIFDGLLVGGLGIAGGAPEQDIQVAELTLAEIGAEGAES
ncbi:heme-binding protein [Microbacterium sp. LWS13-1.2]|uniref:Heme-binding protein n=1 Tax=Microbacterium sp. LWS13-1.2 TaxID=3135264 RepID=A0AAU6SAK5_9MICO